MNNGPAISIVMVTHDNFARIEEAVGFLGRQTVADQIELIVTCPSRDELDANADTLAPFHTVQVVELGAVSGTGEATAAGIMVANAPYVGYGEQHSYPIPTLFETVIGMTGSGAYAAVGWGMGNANPGLVSWAHLYGQFSPVVAPVTPGVVPVLAGHHAVYRRDLLLEYEAHLPGMLGNENVLQRDLHRRGYDLYLTDAFSKHLNISRFLSYARLDFMGQLGFATERAQLEGWSFGRRVFYAMAMPLVPFIRLRRSVQAINRTGRRHLLPQVAFIMFGAMLAGAAGEAFGYLFGTPQEMYATRLNYEIDRQAYVVERDKRTP